MIIGGETISRRNALKSIFGGLAPVAFVKSAQEQEVTAPVGTLAAPRMAGPGLERTTDWDNDPYLIEIEESLRCMCGCNQSVYQCRTTDFTCGVWPATHRRLIGMVESGLEAQEIVDVFIAENGLEVLMAPPTTGFNLTAYLLPGFAITAVGSALVWFLAQRHNRVRSPAATVAVNPANGVHESEFDPEAEDAIQKEMAKLDL